MLMDVPTVEEQRLPNLAVKDFYTEFHPVADGTTRAVDFVKWTKRGDLHTSVVIEAIHRLKKPLPIVENGQQMENPRWTVIKPKYLAWKDGQDIPASGTPLGSWGMLNKAQVQVLRDAGFKTVEDLAGVEDNQLGGIRLPSPREIRDRARQMVEVQKNHTAIASLMAPRDAEIAALKGQIDADREQREADRAMIQSLTAMLEQMQQAQRAPVFQAPPPPVMQPLPEPPRSRPLVSPEQLSSMTEDLVQAKPSRGK